MIRTLKFWAVVFLFAEVLDMASTLYAIRLPGFVELNPLFSIMGGGAGMVITKVAVSILVLLIAWRLNYNCARLGAEPLGTYILAAVATVTLLAGLCNVAQAVAALGGWQGVHMPPQVSL